MNAINTENRPTLEGIPADASDQDKLQALVETISAYIEHFHGGRAEMVSYDGERVQIRLSGACDGCALAPTTLHGWVEGTIKQFFPAIQGVDAA